MRPFYFLFFLIILGNFAIAQILVKDINSDTASTFGEFDNPEFVYLSSKSSVFFVADDGVRGKELWKTSGTTVGTMIVKDIKAFKDVNGSGAEPRYLTVFNNLLYFFANDGTGNGLWKSDGLAAGTLLVKNMDSGVRRSARTCEELIVASKYLYFYHSGASGVELWRSDGTTSGTQMVKDGFVEIRNLTVMGGLLYFAGQEEGGEMGLWRSDGTSGGTLLVKQISIRYEIKAIDNVLFFAADDGTGDLELWRSEGSEYTTRRVKDINPSGSANPLELAVMGKTLFFYADDGTNGIELWRSNGEEGNTVLVKNVNSTGDSSPTGFTPMLGNLYFVADDGSGVKLFKTDGTTQGTLEVKPSTGQMKDPAYLCAAGNILYFSADNTTEGYELWKTDGTQAGTVMLKDINAGTGHSHPRQLTNCNNILYFTAYDGSTMSRELKIGREIWKSQGNGLTTSMVLDINTNSTHAFDTNFENQRHLASVGTNFHFVADDGTNGYEIYKTDGTAANTKRLTSSDKDIHTLIGTSSTLFAVIYENPNYLLYRLNTTNNTLEKVGEQDIFVKVSGGDARVAVSGANLYYQRASDDQVWVTGGANAGQVVTAGGVPVVGLNGYVLVNNILNFGGTNGLYKISTAANLSTEIKDTYTNSISDATNLVSFKNTLYFIRTGDGDIWKVDAAGQGVRFHQDQNGYNINYQQASTNYLFFTVNEARVGYRLWQTNGTSVSIVKDGNGNMFYLPALELKSTGTLVYFVTKTENETLFQTDGTQSNTKPVKDATGRVFSDVRKMNVLGTKLYFAYDDGVHGLEFWETAGTTITTKMTKEVNPYGGITIGATFVMTGKFYFIADDGVSAEYGHGKELFCIK